MTDQDATDKGLGRALLNVDRGSSPGGPDPRQVAGAVLDRDRRTIRLLAGAAILFWTLTAAGLIGLCPFYVMMVAPRLRAYHAGRASLVDDWDDWAMVGEWAAYWLLGCTIALLLAALSTVLLVLVSRRATLRQIKASLAAISEQLRSGGAIVEKG